MNQQEFREQMAIANEDENIAYDVFLQRYERHHQLPKEQEVKLDWEFNTALLTSMAAILLASFRTGQAFYLAASVKGNPYIGWAEAIVSIFAIEGSVVLFSLQRARNAKKTDAGSNQIGLWTAFAISMLAGLYQSVGLLNQQGSGFVVFLNWLVVISMGVGATIIAWLAGDILGVQVVRREFALEKEIDRLKNATIAYNANLQKKWQATEEYQEIVTRKKLIYQQLTSNLPSNLPSDEQVSGNSPTWPKLLPMLTPDMLEFMANSEPRDIVARMMDDMGIYVSPRNASNWRQNAREVVDKLHSNGG